VSTNPLKANISDDNSYMNVENVKKLNEFINYENKHFPLKRMVLFLGLLALLIVVSLLRGSKYTPSIVDMEKCIGVDWVLIIFVIIVCCSMSFVAIKKN
jgi:hypothetical protein